VSWHGWVTLLVVADTVYVLARDLLTPGEAFAGFSNPAPITVAALYVLTRAVEKTGALQPVVNATLGEGRGLRASLARLLLPSAAASGFLNNTPIVTMLVPQEGYIGANGA